MIVDLDIRYTDTSAAQLELSLDTPVLPAEATVHHDVGTCAIELRLLRASHQVVLTQDGCTVVETVACLGAKNRLPTSRLTSIDPWDHVIDIDIREHDGPTFAHTMRGLLAEARADTVSLAGRYPGHPMAVTGLQITGEDPVSWRSWHAYPQYREIVFTRTQVTPRERAAHARVGRT